MNKPRYTIYKTRTPIVIDGKLNGKIWDKAPEGRCQCTLCARQAGRVEAAVVPHHRPHIHDEGE